MTLTEYRNEIGWSQAELARHAGISNPTVSKAERGEGINSRSAILICKALTKELGRTIRPKDIEGLNVTT
jgi:transcriptional regulator with XRE-family HTH domain